jgi:hypothetical protein
MVSVIAGMARNLHLPWLSNQKLRGAEVLSKNCATALIRAEEWLQERACACMQGRIVS